MSYLVLARKWRPQAFADMTGQEHVVRTLSNAIAQQRVAHGFLFCGPRGVGKTTAARLLARALNCEKGPTAEPCGKCLPCTEIAAGTSVDVAEIDGASNNSVEDVRQIRERVTYLPQRDRHKIYIIDEVHMLSTAAFNALLKTLEEPPPHVKFIFATTEPHKLPDTILSRCQRHNFRRIPAQRMAERVKQIAEAEGARLSDRAIALLVRQSEGGMRDALSMLDMVLSACGNEPTDEAVAEALGAVDRTAVHEICRALVQRDAKPVLARIEDLHARGTDFKRLAEEIALYLRHLLVARSIGEAPAELADSERKEVLALGQEADPVQLTRLFDLVQGAIWEVSRAAQPRLAMEVALLKCIHLAPGAPVSELIARVESLARRLDPNATPSSTPAAEGGRPGSRPFRTEVDALPPSAPAVAPAAPTPVAPPAPAPAAPPATAPIASSAPAPAPATPAPAPVAPVTEPASAPATGPRAEPAAPAPREITDPTAIWREVVQELRAQRKEMLADSLAHGRVLSLVPGRVRIGYGPLDGMYRSQAARGQKDAQAALEKVLGVPCEIVIDSVAASDDSTLSIAEEEYERTRAREERLKREGREHPAVLAAMKIFGGKVEDVRVLEEETDEEFAPAPDDLEEAEA
jgi:DNA polymerase-3 subunit gamma/tau